MALIGRRQGTMLLKAFAAGRSNFAIEQHLAAVLYAARQRCGVVVAR